MGDPHLDEEKLRRFLGRVLAPAVIETAFAESRSDAAPSSHPPSPELIERHRQALVQKRRLRGR